MDEQNKLVEEIKDEKQSCNYRKVNSKCRVDPFPPKLKGWNWILFSLAWVFVLAGLMFVGDQFCFRKLPSCVCGTYIALAFVLIGLIIDRWIQHKLIVHEARLEDISVMDALFVEAECVEPTLNGPMKNKKYFKQKKKELMEEVNRLKKIGNRGWTEYQVLSLNQMLVDFLKKDELKARARSSLADLEDYAEDSAYRYDQRQYDRWKDNINNAIDKIDKDEEVQNKEKPNKLGKDAEKLRAELRTLLDHIASYNENWSSGSAILNGIRICSVLSIPLLLGMGLLPIIHPDNVNSSDKILSFFNWGLLGAIGAIAAVLLNLRKSDYVEVGNTEGIKELWRTIPGIGLGFLAGTLAYWMIAGGLFTTGSIVPDLSNATLKEIGLSTLWTVASGFYFEKVFDRMVSTTLG